MRAVALDAHASTASITLLAPPKFAIDELRINLYARRNAGNNGDQRFSVRFSGSAKTQHCLVILSDFNTNFEPSGANTKARCG